jgi:hypothetical protein
VNEDFWYEKEPAEEADAEDSPAGEESRGRALNREEIFWFNDWPEQEEDGEIFWFEEEPVEKTEMKGGIEGELSAVSVSDERGEVFWYEDVAVEEAGVTGSLAGEASGDQVSGGEEIFWLKRRLLRGRY